MYGSVVRAAINSAVCWTALADFCEVVMRRKERAERERRTLERQKAIQRNEVARFSSGSDDHDV